MLNFQRVWGVAMGWPHASYRLLLPAEGTGIVLFFFFNVSVKGGRAKVEWG